MGSFFHILRHNRQVKLPTKMVFYDCETSEHEIKPNLVGHKLKVGVACYLSRDNSKQSYSELWWQFTKPEQFIDYLESVITIGSRLLVFAHQQQFDFIVINGFNLLAQRGWKISRHIITSNLFIVIYKKERKTLVFLDTLNYFKSSIESIGEMLNLPKGKIDFKTCSMAELIVYCKRDVEIIKEVMKYWITFINELDLGNFKFTIAGQSFTAYTHRFMKHKIYIHANPIATKLERLSYRGGRVECFRLGRIDTKVYGLDINSLYSLVMRNNSFPTKLVKCGGKLSIKSLKYFLQFYQMIIRAKITIDSPYIGIKRERLIFPIGTFDAILTTSEIEWVLARGKINQIYQYTAYEHEFIFKLFVNEFYEHKIKYKKEGNNIYYELVKLILNSLYGKFGQFASLVLESSADPSFLYGVEQGISIDTGQRFVQYVLGNQLYQNFTTQDESRDSFVAIASHVTAFARGLLFDLITEAGWENVYYIDTDSLFVNEIGLDNLSEVLDEYEIGKLKIEKEGDFMNIYNLKDYEIGEHIVRKGIKKNAITIKANVFQQDQFLKVKSLLRANSIDTPLVRTITKTLKREYKKGIVLEEGKVMPFELDE